jgi:hypothetical protein
MVEGMMRVAEETGAASIWLGISFRWWLGWGNTL